MTPEEEFDAICKRIDAWTDENLKQPFYADSVPAEAAPQQKGFELGWYAVFDSYEALCDYVQAQRGARSN